MEEFEENWIKIHGYSSNSDRESETDDFDALYEKMMPPPVKIDPLIHRIIEIGSHNKTVLTAQPKPEKNTLPPQPQQKKVKQKKLSKGQKTKMRKAAEENVVSSKNKIVIVNTPQQGQRNDVEILSKGQRKRRNKAMRKAAEKNVESGAVTNTQTDSCVKKKKTKNKKKKAEKTAENVAETTVKHQDGTTIASVKTKKKVETKTENDAEITVKSQDGIANTSVKKKKKKKKKKVETKTENDAEITVKSQDGIANTSVKKKKKKKTEAKTENHADTRIESESFDDMNFYQLQERYPAFKILTHTFDYLQGRVLKNQENIIHKHLIFHDNVLNYTRLCVQFQKQLLGLDCRSVHFTNVLKVVDNFFTNLSALNTVHKTIFQEAQQKRVFCVCNFIKTVAMHHHDFLQFEKKSIQKIRTKGTNISVVPNILYNLDYMVLRFFTLNKWEYKFVESEDDLVSYVIVQCSLILLEYTRKIMLDMIRRVESGCVDYPCLGSYRDVFVAYGQPPGLLFASFVKNGRFPRLLSSFCTANKETQTDNQDDNSQKMLNEWDDGHNFGSCSGSMENIDETSSLSDLENEQTQLSFAIIEDLTENRKFFYDTYNTKFNSKSWRRFRTSYLNGGESSCIDGPEITLTHEENGNFTEYLLQNVTKVCDLKKMNITLVTYLTLRFLHDFVFTF